MRCVIALVFALAVVSAMPLKLRRLSTDVDADAELMGGNTGPYGIDVSVSHSVENFKCFLQGSDYKGPLPRDVDRTSKKNDGPTFTAAVRARIKAAKFTKAVIRVPLTDGKPFQDNFKHAIEAGYKPADLEAYFIGFVASRGAAGAQTTMLNVAAQLAKIPFKVGRLWLDVEGSLGGSAWTSSVTKNCAYIQAVLKYIKDNSAKFPPIGIYTSQHYWSTLMGNKNAERCNIDYANIKLWYAAYNTAFDNHAFGGIKQGTAVCWPSTSSAVVQWHGTTGFCGGSVDMNRYP